MKSEEEVREVIDMIEKKIEKRDEETDLHMPPSDYETGQLSALNWVLGEKSSLDEEELKERVRKNGD